MRQQRKRQEVLRKRRQRRRKRAQRGIQIGIMNEVVRVPGLSDRKEGKREVMHRTQRSTGRSPLPKRRGSSTKGCSHQCSVVTLKEGNGTLLRSRKRLETRLGRNSMKSRGSKHNLAVTGCSRDCAWRRVEHGWLAIRKR